MAIVFTVQPTDVRRDKEFALAVKVHDDVNPGGTLYTIGASAVGGEGSSGVVGILTRSSDENGDVEFAGITMQGGRSGPGICFVVTCGADGGQSFSHIFTVFKPVISILQQPAAGRHDEVGVPFTVPVRLKLVSYPDNTPLAGEALSVDNFLSPELDGRLVVSTDVNGEALFDDLRLSTYEDTGEVWLRYEFQSTPAWGSADPVMGSNFHINQPIPDAPTNLKSRIVKLHA